MNIFKKPQPQEICSVKLYKPKIIKEKLVVIERDYLDEFEICYQDKYEFNDDYSFMGFGVFSELINDLIKNKLIEMKVEINRTYATKNVLKIIELQFYDIEILKEILLYTYTKRTVRFHLELSRFKERRPTRISIKDDCPLFKNYTYQDIFNYKYKFLKIT